MKKEIKKQIKTLRELAESKRNAVIWAHTSCAKSRLRQEAEELEKQADELKKVNKG